MENIVLVAQSIRKIFVGGQNVFDCLECCKKAKKVAVTAFLGVWFFTLEIYDEIAQKITMFGWK